MPSKKPLTILIINHNYQTYLKRCLSSILKNDLKIINEIIIVDDASTDKSIQIIKSLKKLNKKISIYEVKFNSLSKTLNYVINKVKSEWILKIDADDFIHRDMIKQLFKFKNGFDFIYADFYLFNKNKTIKKKQIVKKNFLKYFYHPIGSGNLYKKKLWLKVGGYYDNNKFKDDVYFWIKILNLKNLKTKHVNKYLYFYRQHNKSMSKNFFKKYFTLFKIIYKNLTE